MLWNKHIVQFQWVSHPKMSDLLLLSDFRYYDKPIYLIQKIGHFSGFLALTLIASVGARTSGTFWKGVGFAASYAVFTELLQPFFGRDGRVTDMFIDGAGIAIAAFFAHRVSRKRWIGARRYRPYAGESPARR